MLIILLFMVYDSYSSKGIARYSLSKHNLQFDLPDIPKAIHKRRNLDIVYRDSLVTNSIFQVFPRTRGSATSLKSISFRIILLYVRMSERSSYLQNHCYVLGDD